MYLKSQYGSGYHLTVTKNKDHCNPEDVLQFIKQYIPRTRLIEDLGSEMTFIMPTFDEAPCVLTVMLENLETLKNSLGIDKYGISHTTLEEVCSNMRIFVHNRLLVFLKIDTLLLNQSICIFTVRKRSLRW